MEEIKPNKKVFVTFRFLRSSLVLLLIFLIIGAIASKITVFAWPALLALFIIIGIINYISLNVRYRKEKYILKDDKIINRGGGIFSDYETELNPRNITNVSMVFPFIEYLRFGTGHVNVQSAGSGATEVNMISLDKASAIYKKISKIMQHNGFELGKEKLIQQESPHILGVIFESGQRFLGTLGAIFLILLGNQAFTYAFFNRYFLWAVILLVLLLAGVFTWAVLVFFDLKNRKYTVYSQLVTYNEGFLTKRYAFIPIENLADSSSTQNFIDRIFGLYDVIISSQGAGQEIKFKNMANGQLLEENLDKLISSTKSLAGKKEVKKESKETEEVKREAPKADTSYTDEFQMDMMRTMFPLLVLMVLLFPLIFIWAILLIPVIIKVSATKYLVKQNSMEEKYSFISTKSKEFTNEKITAIIFRESIIDKMFDTFSIHFWSIGSAQDIRFKNIKKQEGLIDSIIAKSGIQTQQELYRMQSSFGAGRMFKAVLPFTIILAILILVGGIATAFFMPVLAVPVVLLLLAAIIILYKREYYKHSKVRFYKDYIHFSKGLLIKQDYYVLYNNVKDITTTKYPFSGHGSVKFNVAGEHIEGQGNQQAVVSNSFTVHYIENIASKDELIDQVFYSRPSAEKIKDIENNPNRYRADLIKESKPSLKNPMFILVVGSVIIFPLIVLFPITIPLVAISVKVKSYRIEDYRAVAKWGILYKNRTSIVFNKIDHINTSQGFLNKMFKNGNVTINTVGSSMPELVIANIPDYKEFYETMNKYY